MATSVAVFSSLVIIWIVAVGTAEGKFQQGKGEWTHELDLDTENGLKVKWKNSPAPQESNGARWLTMEVFARTKGYVGLGFSPHGGMDGADIVIGWVDSNGIAHLKVHRFYM